MARTSVRSFVIGGLVGMAAGMILLPQLNGDAKNKLMEKGKQFTQNASNMMEGIEIEL